ncbi:hypothetical protein [Chlorella virus XW01]|nr:hypothetical protein [Chlorella virus XW01]
MSLYIMINIIIESIEIKNNIVNYKSNYLNFFVEFITINNINNIYLGYEGFVSLLTPFAILNNLKININNIDNLFLENSNKIVDKFMYFHDISFNYNFIETQNISSKTQNISSKTQDISSKTQNINKSIAAFTLGIDSFYTLYSNLNNEELDTLIFIIGFDIKLYNNILIEKTIENIKTVCNIYNKKLIICKTNLRDQIVKNKLNKYKGFDWGKYLHGVAIFNIMYLLSNNYNKFYLPSSHIKKKYIWGSTFEIDNYYSSSFFEIIIDGYKSRNSKIEYLLRTDLKFLDYLRVCWENQDNEYNCGKCEKCIRTLIIINKNGYINLAKTFNNAMHISNAINLESSYEKIFIDKDIKNKYSINSYNENVRYSKIFGNNINCSNLGFIIDPKLVINEIERLGYNFYEKKPVEGKTSSELYKNTKGWTGIALINDSGLSGSEGLRFAGTKNNKNKGAVINSVYTNEMNSSVFFQNLIKDIENKFNTKVGLTRIFKLEKGGYIYPHSDGNIFGKIIYRCHIPIITNYPDVGMMIDNEHYFLETGCLIMTDTSKIHSVYNNSDIDRIHIVLDLLKKPEITLKIKNGLPCKLIPILKHIKNNNNKLILSFGGFENNKFYEYDYLTNNNYNVIFFRDVYKNWYINGIANITYDIEDTCNYIKNIINNYIEKQSLEKQGLEKQGLELIVIGEYSGSFGALLFGLLLNANKIIVNKAYTFIDKKTKEYYNETQWINDDFYLSIEQNYNYNYLNLSDLNMNINCPDIYILNTNNIHIENLKKNKKLNKINILDNYNLIYNIL